MATTTAKRDSMDASTSELSTKLSSTTLNPPTTPKPRASLSTLPASIRNKIYAYALDTELVNHGHANISYSHILRPDGTLYFGASRPPFPDLGTALFYVNKAIGAEARRYFYSKNLFVRFAIYSQDARHAKSMLEESGLLFSVANPEAVELCEEHAMDLRIVEKGSEKRRAVVLFPAQYLPRLINFLDQANRAAKSWAPGHRVEMNLQNTYGFPVSRVQGDLLELFRLLDNLGDVDIGGEGLLPGYAEGLRESMTAAEFTATGFLRTVTGLVDHAEEARKGGDAQLAAQLAQSCIISLTYAFLTRPEALHSESEKFTRDVQRLRWRCEVEVGKALFALHQQDTEGEGKWLSSLTLSAEKKKEIAKNMLAAETATSQALSLSTDSPNPDSNPWFQSLPAELIPPNKAAWFTDEERGLTWYACGLVHIALGEYLFAAGDLERASGLYPGGEGIAEAFEKAREAIDWKVKPGTGMKSAVRLASE